MVGSVRWFRDESTSVAATGLIVLTTGFSTQDQVLLDRLFDTAIGIVVGLAVNMVVWPPLRDYSAARAIDAVDDGVGELLRDMADRLRGSPAPRTQVTEWVDRTRDARPRHRPGVGAAAAGQGERPAQPPPRGADA